MSARAFGLLLVLAAGTAAAQSTLVDAVRNDDHATAVALLAERADPNQAESDGTTPLHWAVHHDDADLVARLLEAGANVAASNDYGATPMSEVAVTANVAVLEALLEAGADASSPNADGQTALMVVARGGNTAAAQALIEAGADVNAREQRKGQTALMWAVAQSQPAMGKLLLDHGAEVDARSTVTAGYTDVALLLVERGASLKSADADGVTPVDAANGKLRGGRRGGGTAYPETAEALQGLLASAR